MPKMRSMVEMVFRRSPRTDLSAHKGDLQLFNLLLALDGKRTVAAIAKEDFYELDLLSAKLEEMLVKGFIEPVAGLSAGRTDSVEPAFFNQLTTELTLMVGPVAGMLVKDTLERMGCDSEHLSLSKVEELLSGLAAFIQDASQAADFQARMRTLAENRHA